MLLSDGSAGNFVLNQLAFISLHKIVVMGVNLDNGVLCTLSGVPRRKLGQKSDK